MLLKTILAFMVWVEKLVEIQIGLPLNVTCCFSLMIFKTLYLFCLLGIFIIMCLIEDFLILTIWITLSCFSLLWWPCITVELLPSTGSFSELNKFWWLPISTGSVVVHSPWVVLVQKHPPDWHSLLWCYASYWVRRLPVFLGSNFHCP